MAGSEGSRAETPHLDQIVFGRALLPVATDSISIRMLRVMGSFGCSDFRDTEPRMARQEADEGLTDCARRAEYGNQLASACAPHHTPHGNDSDTCSMRACSSFDGKRYER